MSSIAQQETPCGVISAIWNLITISPGEKIEYPKLIQQLTIVFEDQGKLYGEACNSSRSVLNSALLLSLYPALVERYIEAAFADQLIVQCVRPKQRGRHKLNPSYTLPQWQSYIMPDEQPDKYCYECHNVGDVVKCDGCLRSFHEGCIKTADEKQLELEQFISKQKRIAITAFNSRTARGRSRRLSGASLAVTEESTVSSMDFSAAQSSVELADSTVVFQQGVDDSVDVIVGEPVAEQIKHESIEQCDHIKREDNVKEEDLLTDEAQFVCMVRPPNRRLERSLNTPTIKPEDSGRDRGAGQAACDTITARYCYACRLLQDRPNQASPDIGKCELNYLLNFVVQQYKSWIPKDTFSTSKHFRDKSNKNVVLTRRTIDVCKKMLLRIPTSFACVQEKIAVEQYTSLEEFHVDILDIVHNVAIIHGESSMGYSAAMYFLADCVYDLREIRQCPDCYRHSAEKAEPDWFARPCRTRHELVFAKQTRFQYWPAKVVRVVNNWYDVRFFGGNHPRALIAANCVKPIDTELGTLGVKHKYGGFQLAMKEMLKYQSLAEGFREHFAFTSVTDQMRAVVNRTVESVLPPELRDGDGGDRFVYDECASRPKTRKRNQKTKQPSVVHQTVPLGAVSPPPNVVSTDGSDRSSRAKRRETLSLQQTPAKKSRAPYQADTETPENDFGQSGFDVELGASSSTTLARTKQKEIIRFPEKFDTFRLKQLFQQATDLEEAKQAALKLLQNKEDYFARRLEWLKDTHKQQISEIKKKQWCVVCEKEARIPCCWNTSYCTINCQERNWPAHQKQHLVAGRSDSCSLPQSGSFTAQNDRLELKVKPTIGGYI
uniref:PWWP domain-containing protein n=1 Tax=Anopheles christyi TaxID=43041 RepID=A0A182JQF0_9DIPT